MTPAFLPRTRTSAAEALSPSALEYEPSFLQAACQVTPLRNSLLAALPTQCWQGIREGQYGESEVVVVRNTSYVNVQSKYGVCVMQTAVIIGAGPAGLTAALEFCRRSSINPIIFESTDRIGGISCTICHNGNRIDIGGHRFFSKSHRVMNWWTELLPIASGEENLAVTYRNQKIRVSGDSVSDDSDRVMLVRPRKSRIYFMRSFFDYPLSLSSDTIRKLGIFRVFGFGISYARAKMFPRSNEETLEDFLINRFGMQLYVTFFKSYTEKVWGIPCRQLSASWGAQRIKGLSLRSAVFHFLKKRFSPTKDNDIRQRNTETSLIEKFLYPKFGPGQLWEYVACLVQRYGGQLHLKNRVVGINTMRGEDGADRIESVIVSDHRGQQITVRADYVFSTMPVKELVEALGETVPDKIKQIANGLSYRDFITVGLLVDRLLLTESDGSALKDTWIYVQESDVLVGRLQIFNNWSSYLVADPSKVWIGLEYFCYESDDLWKKSDRDLVEFAVSEASKIGILRGIDVLDSKVVRVPKAYPAYTGTYDRFDEVVQYIDRFENLFLVGRNGMHRYNNQDHSMLTAMIAVDNILEGIRDKSNLWEINTEQEYHEEKSDSTRVGGSSRSPVSLKEQELA